jgi:transposase
VRAIEHETRVDRLQAIALALVKENRRLRTLLRAQGDPEVEALELELRFVAEQLAARNRALFGPSSEKDRRETESKTPTAKRGHGPREQPALPLVEEVHELDEADRICPKCGGALHEIAGQYEESEEIDVVARSYRLVRHKRKKYRAAAGAVSRRRSVRRS